MLEKDFEKEVKKYEEEILDGERHVIELQKRIEKEEKEILASEGKIYKAIGGVKFLSSGFGKYQATFLRTGFAKRFSKHKILYTLTTLTSVVLVWRGIWNLADITPGIENPVISILVGIAIIFIVDSFSDVIKS